MAGMEFGILKTFLIKSHECQQIFKTGCSKQFEVKKICFFWSKRSKIWKNNNTLQLTVPFTKTFKKRRKKKFSPLAVWGETFFSGLDFVWVNVFFFSKQFFSRVMTILFCKKNNTVKSFFLGKTYLTRISAGGTTWKIMVQGLAKQTQFFPWVSGNA